jgi:alkanesulfonate monooxygenase SsuD/methylene tetrahydromethanopterin reductase-like flavin-dependent oxidoreductase (luciferase family)
MTMRLLREGRLIPVPPVEKALSFLESHPSSPSPGDPRGNRRAVIGDPSTVRAGLEQVARDYGAEEIMVVTITHSHEARKRSYELIADAFVTASPASATAS